MSQASKSHALTAGRHRRKVARLTVDAGALVSPDGRPLPTWRGREPMRQLLRGGWTFDVLAARSFGTRLVAYDRQDFRDHEAGPLRDWREAHGCRGGQPPKPSSFPSDWMNWRAHVRAGRRLLAALEGQPSECEWCGGGGVSGTVYTLRIGVGVPQSRSNPEPIECGSCHGSGHNRRGTIPIIIASPQVRRRRVDQGVDEYGVRLTADTWLDDERVTGIMGPGCDYFATAPYAPTTATRVVPRGEHRFSPARGHAAPPWTLDQRINGRGWAPKSKRTEGAGMARLFACSPAWRRGEVLAQETKRRRAWEAVGEEWAGQSWMPRGPAEIASDSGAERR